MTKDAQAVVSYIFALFFPVILAVGITDNTNETMPVLYWILCPALFFCAAYFSFPGKLVGDKLKWTVWSVIIGFCQAAALIFLV